MKLDHLAVAGESLAEAATYVEEALGVPLQPGGKHAVFGTHNRLLGLADNLYLEVIAVDPEAEPRQVPRWFDLDRFCGAPRISNWVCSSDNLELALGRMPVDAGRSVALTRGDLRWKMAVPQSGVLPFANMFPALMQWQGPHPASRLTQQGCALRRLVVAHPEAKALKTMVPLDSDLVVFEPGPAGFLAEFHTPSGMRTLQ